MIHDSLSNLERYGVPHADEIIAFLANHDPFLIYMSIFEIPNVDLYRRFEDAGVTDLICAPWMMVPQDTPTEQLAEKRIEEMTRFAEEIIIPMKGT